jgi:small-conductance mechanosensitive channel
MLHLAYPIATIGTAIAIVAAFLINWMGDRYIRGHVTDMGESYRRRKGLLTAVVLIAAAAIVLLWARLLQHTGTFLGIIGAGLAIALREPLLSIAGRIAIFAGNIYRVGDRIQIQQMSGDVIDIGFFYTRMMEIGNWIGGDQFTGRIVQLANATVFGNAVYNYTQNFNYLWDEIKLPVTYESNVKQMTSILTEVGAEYTEDFLKAAEQDLEKMRHSFLVPSFELKPHVFIKVTDNWVELTMRYVVDPKKRREASSYIYERVLDRVRQSDDITIASTTMAVTVYPPEPSGGKDAGKQAGKKQPPKAA